MQDAQLPQSAMRLVTRRAFEYWANPIPLSDYFDRVTDFILAGLRGQAASLCAPPARHE